MRDTNTYTALIEALRFYADGAPVCEGRCRPNYAGCEYPKCHEIQFPTWDQGRVARAALAKVKDSGDD